MKIEEAVKAVSKRFQNVCVSFRVTAYEFNDFKPEGKIEVSGWNQHERDHSRGEGATLQQALDNLLNPPDQMAEVQAAIQEVEGMGK